MNAVTQTHQGELVDTAAFFAPMAADLVDSLVGEHNGLRQRIEALGQAVGQECFAGALHYFIEGNQSHRERWFNIEKLFDVGGAIAKLNATSWNKALQLTDVLDCMPQKRRDEWFEQIQQCKAPEFEESTVRATLNSLMAGRAKFFAERVDGIFRALSHEHVTNVPQGFSKRMILGYVFSDFGGATSQAGHINDLRAVIAKFMGRDEPKWNSSRGMIEITRRHSGEWMTLDGGALRIRTYMKGTAHIEVHPDMAWRLNAVLASLYPAAIPAEFREKPKRKKVIKDFVMMGRPLPFAVIEVLAGMRQTKQGHTFGLELPYGIDNKPAKVEALRVLQGIGGVVADRGIEFDYDPRNALDEIVTTGCVPDQKAHQFYPTPEAVALAAIELAQIGPDDKCLEPSAGLGGLADYLPKERTRCVEISQLHCNVLSAKGFPAVACDDFLAWAALPGHHGYDRIVMNPPYSEGRWQAHLQAAADLLKPDGRLVAILPASAKGKDLLPDWSLEWARTFDNEFAGTSVSVVVLIAQRAGTENKESA